MLNAAFAQGIPTRVIAIMTAAMSQPSAISRPPHTIQAMFSRRERTDILRHLNTPGANVDTEIGACQPGRRLSPRNGAVGNSPRRRNNTVIFGNSQHYSIAGRGGRVGCALAVLRLITSSSLVGCWTGRSAGS